jgi:hypothetical protein
VPTAELGEGGCIETVDCWAVGKRGRRKFGMRKPKNSVFWALYANQFINTFINSLFINQKLKTVYNPLRNYKQDPSSATSRV